MKNSTISWYEKNAEEISREYDNADVDVLHTLSVGGYPPGEKFSK